MKRIEAIIRTEAYPEVRSMLENMNVYSLSKHDISGGAIISGETVGSKKGLFLSKIELITSDKDAHKIINMIAKYADEHGKIFVSDLNEIIDARTFESKKELEITNKSDEQNIPKRSRLVPLQKYTMSRAEKFYDIHKDTLRSEYRIRSYSDFINFCIVSYLPILEDEIKHNAIMENRKL